ncbi:hypothetical protein BSKO_14035 [Bryopsis sp. KO-2023]|nr:hypothetical protein BSKO_14035 [Bryopsis sp. KO-2023]
MVLARYKYRVYFTAAYVVGSSAWMKYVAPKVKPGWKRFFVVLPLLLANFMLPFLFKRKQLEELARIAAAFLIMWLSSFKILAHCINRGPLCSDFTGKERKWSFLQFTAILLLPLLPTEGEEVKIGDSQQVLGKQEKLKQLCRVLLMKLFCFFSVPLEMKYIPIARYSPLKDFLYTGCIYGFLGTLMDTTSLLALSLLDIRCMDNFDNPILSTSVTDMWGRRWNTMTGTLLKSISYDIVFDGQFISDKSEIGVKKRPSLMARAMSVMAVFFFSGVMHEILFWYAAGIWGWRWFAFFMWFGPFLIIEKALKGLFRAKFGVDFNKVPFIIQNAYFWVCILLPSYLFFVPQAEMAGSTRMISQIADSITPPRSP